MLEHHSSTHFATISQMRSLTCMPTLVQRLHFYPHSHAMTQQMSTVNPT